jgi:hypothetical protein
MCWRMMGIRHGFGKLSKNIRLILIVLFGTVFIGLSYNMYKIYQVAPYLFDNSYRENPSMSYFTSKYGGYSISYPSVLRIFDSENGSHGDQEVVSILTNEFEYNTVIVYKRKSTNNGMESLINWGKEKTSKIDELYEISIEPYSSARYNGLLREYSYKNYQFYNRRDDHCYDWLLDENGYEYNFSFCVNSKYWDISKDEFLEMLNSIQLK